MQLHYNYQTSNQVQWFTQEKHFPVFLPSCFIIFIFWSFSYLNFMVSTFPIHFPLNWQVRKKLHLQLTLTSSLDSCSLFWACHWRSNIWFFVIFKYFIILVENLILISVLDEDWTNDKWSWYWIFPLHRSPVKHKLILKVGTWIFIQRKNWDRNFFFVYNIQ